MPGLAALLVQDDTGLTLREIVRDIPHDAAAVVVYVLLAIFIVAVWFGTRSSRGAEPPDSSGAG